MRSYLIVGCAVVMLFGADVLSAQNGTQDVYQSTPAGILIEKISREQIGKHDYVAYVNESGAGYIFRLEKNGNEIERREKTVQEKGNWIIKRFRDGKLVSMSRYENDVLVEERTFREETLVERIVYRYKENELDRIEFYNGEGDLDSFVEYRRGDSGRVYSVLGRRNDEPVRNIFRFSEGRIYQEWYGSDSEGTLLHFNTEGELVEKERWSDGDLVRLEEIDREDTGRVKRVDEGDLKIREYYDKHDNLLRRTVDRDGKRIETVVNDYQQDRLTESRITTPGKINRTEYEYDEAGDLLKTSEFVNTKLVKITEWRNDGLRVEELYKAGSPILRVFFENDKKIREEVIE